MKNKLSASLIAGGMALVGLITGIATMASAQSAATTAAPATSAVTTQAAQAVDTPEPGDVPDTATGAETRGHAPLGGDGVVSSVSGTTVVMGEESNEGGASYTVDASKATVTVNGTTGTLAAVKPGEKIFVQGTTNGTTVTATSISVGHRGEGVDKTNDTDGSAASEGSEPSSSSDAAGQ